LILSYLVYLIYYKLSYLSPKFKSYSSQGENLEQTNNYPLSDLQKPHCLRKGHCVVRLGWLFRMRGGI